VPPIPKSAPRRQFGLTIAVDPTVAIEAGVVLASILFVHRMAEAVRLQSHQSLIAHGDDGTADVREGADNGVTIRARLPKGVEYLELTRRQRERCVARSPPYRCRSPIAIAHATRRDSGRFFMPVDWPADTANCSPAAATFTRNVTRVRGRTSHHNDLGIVCERHGSCSPYLPLRNPDRDQGRCPGEARFMNQHRHARSSQ